MTINKNRVSIVVRYKANAEVGQILFLMLIQK